MIIFFIQIKVKPISKPGTAPSFNGCGSFDVNVDFSKYNGLSGFNACCNNHDICYNKCDTTKAVCDTTFYSCLKTAVDNSNNNFFKKIGNYCLFFF